MTQIEEDDLLLYFISLGVSLLEDCERIGRGGGEKGGGGRRRRGRGRDSGRGRRRGRRRRNSFSSLFFKTSGGKK